MKSNSNDTSAIAGVDITRIIRDIAKNGLTIEVEE